MTFLFFLVTANYNQLVAYRGRGGKYMYQFLCSALTRCETIKVISIKSYFPPIFKSHIPYNGLYLFESYLCENAREKKSKLQTKQAINLLL